MSISYVKPKPVRSEELLAVLAQEQGERIVRAEQTRHAKRDSRFGGNLRGDLCQLVPGPGSVVGQVHLGLLKKLGVGHDDRAVDAGIDAHQLVVDLARVDRALDKLGHIDILQIQEGAATAVLGDIGHVHLNDVGRVTAGGLGGQLVPVAGEVTRLALDRHIGVRLLERSDLRFCVLVAGRVAPPSQSQLGRAALAATALRTTATLRTRGATRQPHSGGRSSQPSGSDQKLPTINGHRSSLRH